MLPADPPPSTAPVPLDYQRAAICRRAARLLLALGLLCILGSVGGVVAFFIWMSANSDSSPGSPEGMGAVGLVFEGLAVILSLIPITFGIIYLVCSRKILSSRRAWVLVALTMTSLQELFAVPSSFSFGNPFTSDPSLPVDVARSLRATDVTIWLISIAFSAMLGFTIYYLIRILREPRIYEEVRLRRDEA